MSTTEHYRDQLKLAFRDKQFQKIRVLLEGADNVKELLLMKDVDGLLPTHAACYHEIDRDNMRLILDTAVQHGIVKQALEDVDNSGRTCLHLAYEKNLSIDVTRLLFKYLSEHTDIKNVLQRKDQSGSTCLHYACRLGSSALDSLRIEKDRRHRGQTRLQHACDNKLSADSLLLLLEHLSMHSDMKWILEEKNNSGRNCLHYACATNLSADTRLLITRLLISFFPSKEIFQNALAAKEFMKSSTPLDVAQLDKVKELLLDPDCWQKCRLWLLQNYEDVFLTKLYPHSFDKTCQALKELTRNGLQHSRHQSTIMLIALMSSPSEFREALSATNYAAPMASSFHDLIKKKGDKKKSDYNCWRKNISVFREFYGLWPSTERKTASTYAGEGSASSCVIQ